MIPAETSIQVLDGKIRISPASKIPADILAELREQKSTAIRLIEAGPEFDPFTLLNEFRGDLADIAHLTDQQMRQAVEVAALWHQWRPRR